MKYLEQNEVFETNSFQMKNYRSIYHVASPFSQLPNYNKILRETISVIIQKATRSSINSIVFPFIGTGKKKEEREFIF